MAHKFKTFKRLFEENADTISEERTKKKGKKIPAMFEDTFIALSGEVYSLAKEKYMERAMKFAEWSSTNFIYNENVGKWLSTHQGINKKQHTTVELYFIWREIEKSKNK